MPSPGVVEYMAFPRLVAVAESVWSPEDKKNYANFLSRLEIHEQRLRQLDVNFRP